MTSPGVVFNNPAPGLNLGGYSATVVSVDDPEGLSRVQVKISVFDGVADHDAAVWARVATAFAGAERGAFFIPDVDDEVLVVFVNGDARLPVVVGSLWNGSAKPPEQLGGSGDSVDRWTITGKAGTKIAIIEESANETRIELKTPGGVTATLKDTDGGAIELEAAGSTITVDTGGVSVKSPGTVSVEASEVTVTSARPMNVKAPMAEFSGVVKCLALDTTTVSGKTYTPGAGNIW